ncbi:unnamed protein product, partial [Rotaria sp. Silwood2]
MASFIPNLTKSLKKGTHTILSVLVARSR